MRPNVRIPWCVVRPRDIKRFREPEKVDYNEHDEHDEYNESAKKYKCNEVELEEQQRQIIEMTC